MIKVPVFVESGKINRADIRIPTRIFLKDKLLKFKSLQVFFLIEHQSCLDLYHYLIFLDVESPDTNQSKFWICELKTDSDMDHGIFCEIFCSVTRQDMYTTSRGKFQSYFMNFFPCPNFCIQTTGKNELFSIWFSIQKIVDMEFESLNSIFFKPIHLVNF